MFKSYRSGAELKAYSASIQGGVSPLQRLAIKEVNAGVKAFGQARVP
jgi:hypothetical protein